MGQNLSGRGVFPAIAGMKRVFSLNFFHNRVLVW
jgi:hypothetical protein